MIEHENSQLMYFIKHKIYTLFQVHVKLWILKVNIIFDLRLHCKLKIRQKFVHFNKKQTSL